MVKSLNRIFHKALTGVTEAHEQARVDDTVFAKQLASEAASGFGTTPDGSSGGGPVSDTPTKAHRMSGCGHRR